MIALPETRIPLVILIVSCLALSFCARQEVDKNTTGIEVPVEETQEQTDGANEPEEAAGNVTISDAYFKIPIKETPEYHSFIYRYERMREEQITLLEENIEQYGLTVDTKNSRSLNSAGYSLYERKEYADAVRFFREAAYLDISNVYGHYNLACSLSLLRDSIWADPRANMDYHHDFNEDYYATKYNLYEPDGNYYHQADNDEICRNEIFEHLTLACLLDRGYLAKAPTDRDLTGVWGTLRFLRLMENIQTGKGMKLYGVWYSPQGLMKESYFMLDGSMSHILPNGRPETRFAEFAYYSADHAINTFTDEIIQSRTSQDYKFTQMNTGYEGFDTSSTDTVTYQWDWEDSQLVIYSQKIITDSAKVLLLPAKAPEYDFRYYKDILKVQEDTLSALPMEKGKEYVNTYSPPYRYVMENEVTLLVGERYEAKTANTLAALALIHDQMEMLDILIKRHTDIDLNHLFLLGCLYAKTDLLARFEEGAYGFDVDKFIKSNGEELFYYAAASSNTGLFKMLYSKYYQTVISNISDKKSFLQELMVWFFITCDNQMYDLIDSIRKGKYDGTL